MDERLLEPGWGGEITEVEAKFIAAKLSGDAILRAKWGFRKRQYYPLWLIKQKAFPERYPDVPKLYRLKPPANAFQKGNTAAAAYWFKKAGVSDTTPDE